MHIETERLLLRPFSDEDAAACYRITNRPKVAHFMSDMVLASEEEALRWLRWINEKSNRHEPCVLLAMVERESGRCIGYIGVALKQEIGEPEILYAVADEFAGRGYVTEAGKALLDWSFRNTDALSVAVLVKPDNPASARVAEKLGFEFTDTRTFAYDGAMTTFRYGRLERPRPGKPEEMAAFFDKRADTYEFHMLEELECGEFYREIGRQCEAIKPLDRLLDLGCGTGLELEGAFAANPCLSVTGIDLSRGMLGKLEEKFPDNELNLVCGSYFDVPFGEAAFDCVLSTYSLHHFTEEQKLGLYGKIFRALRPGGVFLNGDYTAKDPEMQRFHLAECERLRREHGGAIGSFHYDTPFTVETERGLLARAGFRECSLVRQWENTAILASRR